MPSQYIVVGAGLAGLIAAEALACPPSGRQAADVTLIDQAPRAGGVIGTVRRDGWLVECSADSFLATRPEGMALVLRLGLSDELLPIAPGVRRALIFRGGRTLPVPAGFRLLAPGRIDSIIGSELLSPAGKWRVLLERLIPPRARSTPPVEDESLESFAVRRLGREAFERIVQPLVAGIWTADPARLSMAAACPEFWEMEVRHGSLSAGERARLRQGDAGSEASGARYGQFVTLASGMETLVARLAARLETAGVRRIVGTAQTLERQGNDGWSLTVASQSPGGGSPPPETLRAEGVVVAVPSAAAAAILTPVDRELAAQLGEIEYAGSAVVSLGFKRTDVAHPLDAAGLVVPRIEGRKALAISFSSSKFPHRTPAGCVLVRVFLGGALDPAVNQLNDEALVALALGEAADLIGARGDPLLVQVNRWARAMPQYHLGHLVRVARIKERLKQFPGLALAGNAYEGVGIPQVIASGQAAATRLLAGQLSTS